MFIFINIWRLTHLYLLSDLSVDEFKRQIVECAANIIAFAAQLSHISLRAFDVSLRILQPLQSTTAANIISTYDLFSNKFSFFVCF